MRSHWMRILRKPIEYVGGVTTTDLGGDFSIDISSLDVRLDDVGILFWTGSTQDNDVTVSGFTIHTNAKLTGANTNYVVATKVMDGTETSVATTDGNALDDTTVGFVLFRGVTVSGIDINSTGVTNTLPNPPISATMTGVYGLIVVCGHLTGDTWTSRSSSSGYTDAIDVAKEDFNLSYVRVAYKIVTAQENPATFGGTSVFGDSGSHTITLQEA